VVVHPERQRRRTSGGLKLGQQRGVRARVAEVDLEAVALQLEVVEDPRSHEAEQVRRPGVSVIKIFFVADDEAK